MLLLSHGYDLLEFGMGLCIGSLFEVCESLVRIYDS